MEIEIKLLLSFDDHDLDEEPASDSVENRNKLESFEGSFKYKKIKELGHL